MQRQIEAYPSSSPLQCSGRASEILLDLRRKRESLIARNPTLGNGKMKTALNENRLKNFQTDSSSRAKDILGDMKSKRASLSSVLEACKTSSKRKNRSEGPSTAPTAASTRSCLSSYADDDSFCYSESSQDQNPGFEIIIETEESDLCSLSTREEVENAVGTIYQQVIPKALSTISNKEIRDKSIANCQYSLNAISENTAIDFPVEERRMRSKKKKKHRKKSNKKSESRKKKDETRTESSSICYRPAESFRNSSFDIIAEEQLDSTETRLGEDSKRYGLPSEASPSFESQKLLSKEENDLVSNSMKKKKERSNRKKEIKKAKRHTNRTSATVAECSSDEQQSLTAKKDQSHYDCQNERTNYSVSVSTPSISSYRRRPRQDDSSFGSNKPSSQLLPAAPSNSLLLDTDLQQSTSEQKRRKNKNPKSNANIRTVSKPERKCVATRKEKGEKNESYNSENVVVTRGSQSSLLNLQKTSKNNEMFSSRSCQSQKYNLTLSPSFQKERYNPDTPDLKSEESGVIIFQDEIDNSLSLPRLESKRRTWVRSRSKLELAPSIDAPAPRKLGSRSGIEKKSQSEARSTVQSNQNREDCNLAIACKETYTMEDIMAEMNRLAAIQAKEGLKIPSGTVLTLRSNKAKSCKSKDGDNFSTGWSFSEASDVSTLSTFSEETPENPVTFRPKQAPVSDDISKKFCGGLYHIAVMSGMPATQQEI